MASRLNVYEKSLEVSKKLPGPGQYHNYDIKSYGKSVSSTNPNCQNFSIGKDKRFDIPTKNMIQTSPASYFPKDNLNEDVKSNFKKTG